MSKKMEEIKKKYTDLWGGYLDDALIVVPEILSLLSHISTLEKKMKTIQDHANRLSEIITEQTMKRLELEEKVKELEDAINNTGCLVLKNSIGRLKDE